MWKALRDGCLDHALKHIIPEEDLLNMKETNGNTSFDDYNNQVCESIARFLDGVDLLQLVSQYMRMLRCLGSLRLVACFSETNVSSLMWGHYADSHKGYCLEYDFKRVFAEDDELCTRFSFCDVNSAFLAPVVYSNKRLDATKSFLPFAVKEFFRVNGYNQTRSIYPDMLEAFKTMIIKSKDWEYEREWRLATEIPDDDAPPAYGRIARIKPTALYIGAHASKNDSEHLFSLCQRESIPCFKMVEDVYHGDFNLLEIPYEVSAGYAGKSVGME